LTMEPQGMIATLGDAGPCPTIADGTKTWNIGHPTQRAKAELELLVVQAATKNLDDLKDVLPKKEWELEKSKLSGLIRGRAWQTFGQLWAEQVNGPLADALFLLSLAKPHHPEMTLADAERLWLDENDQCRVALGIVVPGFFDLLMAWLPAS